MDDEQQPATATQHNDVPIDPREVEDDELDAVAGGADVPFPNLPIY